MATIKDIAEKARVSVGTVSNVISGKVAVSPTLRQRVLAVIQEMDYHPNHAARSLKVRQTHTLGMVIPDITNPFFPTVVRGAEDAALEHGYVLITCNTDDRADLEATTLSVLRARNVDGILLVVAPSRDDPSHILRAMRAGTPIVCLDRVPPGVPVDLVAVNNLDGSQMCVRHLITQGHRRIGIITGRLDLTNAQERLAGYKAALQEARIKIDPELIVEGDFRTESGYRLGKKLLLSRQHPTALFVSNAMMTLGVIKALDETGVRCPGDIAIAAVDDLPLADVFHPHLTTLAQPAYEIGRRGAELLIQKIKGECRTSDPVRILLEPELKIRESTSTQLPALMARGR